MRGRTRSRCAWLALIALLLVHGGAEVVQAQRRELSQPYLVRITGYLGPKREGQILLTSWKVNRGRDIYDLHVLKLDVLAGNIAYFNIVNQLDFYSPAFSIAGDDRAVDAFLATPPGEVVAIMGYLRVNASIRVLMLDTVEPLALTPTPGASRTP